MNLNPDPGKLSPSIKWGRRLLAFGGLGLMAGGAITKLFFPDQRGSGISPALLWVLIPLWSAMVVGCLLCVMGWVRYPQIAPKLELPDKRFSTPLLKVLWAFLAAIMTIAAVTLMLAHANTLQLVAAYCFFSVFAFLLFLTTIFKDTQYPVTTTYLNVLYLMFAVAIIPLTWPLVIGMEVVDARRRSAARRSYLEDAGSSLSLMQNILFSCQLNFGEAPRKFSRVDEHMFFNLPKPKWLVSQPSDKLNTLFANLAALFSDGVVVWGCIIQANELLFEDGPDNCPGELVYSLDTAIEPKDLKQVANGLAQLKGTHPRDPKLKRIADYLTEEWVRVFGLKVPTSMSSARCRISTALFVRDHLPSRRLLQATLPIIVNRNKPHVAIPLPKEYWPEELIEWWE